MFYWFYWWQQYIHNDRFYTTEKAIHLICTRTQLHNTSHIWTSRYAYSLSSFPWKQALHPFYSAPVVYSTKTSFMIPGKREHVFVAVHCYISSTLWNRVTHTHRQSIAISSFYFIFSITLVRENSSLTQR